MYEDAKIVQKLNRLETHDRFQHFSNQSFDISECCQDLINKRPFGEHPFYIFAHARTADDGVTKRMIWQPRLTKPKAQTNSMLFKAYPGTDKIKIMWMIPARELWDQFTKGKMLQNETICNSIHDFLYHRDRLEKREDDDMSEDAINAIYTQISVSARPRMPY